MKEMLDDYFKIQIKDDQLWSMPKVIKEIPPFIDLLPVFVLKLATDVDYTIEQNWFRHIAEKLGEYYAKFLHYYYTNSGEDQYEDGEDDEVDGSGRSKIHQYLTKFKLMKFSNFS